MSQPFFLFGLTILIGSLYYMQQTVDDTNNHEIFEKYKQWKEEFQKKYFNEEDVYRYLIFYQNFLLIQNHNSKFSQQYEMAINQFMDITEEEFELNYLTLEIPDDFQILENTEDFSLTVNDTVNWKSQVIVKNQGQCGSCWAFSTTGAVEAFYRIKKNQTMNVAEQQLVDCSKVNHGCKGGWPEKALDWIHTNGIVQQSAYPYTAKNGVCKLTTGVYKINGHRRIPANINSLKSAVKSYPVSVCVDASNWSHYGKGIFNNCGKKLNHAVLLVGYDAAGNWIVRNSWSKRWGEQGFIRLQAGNTCGVLNAATQAY